MFKNIKATAFQQYFNIVVFTNWCARNTFSHFIYLSSYLSIIAVKVLVYLISKMFQYIYMYM